MRAAYVLVFLTVLADLTARQSKSGTAGVTVRNIHGYQFLGGFSCYFLL